MNRTKVSSIILSIALIASVGGNFYNYSESKALSNALHDAQKQVEALTQELEQSQLALEAVIVAAEVKIPGYANPLDGMSLEELLAQAEQLQEELNSSKSTLPDGTKRYTWDTGNVDSNKYKILDPEATKSGAQRHDEYRKKFNIPDDMQLDIGLTVYNDKNGNGVKDYIEEGRVFDARRDADPESSLYKQAVASHKFSDAMLQAEREGRLTEFLDDQLARGGD